MPLREEIRSEKNRRRILTAGVFVAITAIGSYAAFFRSVEETDEFKITEVAIGNVTETVSANGKAAYRGYYNLTFPRGGRITFIADEGKTVKQGDVVATLDGTFEKIAVEKARIAVEAAKADVRSKKESSASEEEIRLYETRLRSAESDLESAKRSRERAVSEVQKSFETARTEFQKSEESVRTAKIELERTLAENARSISEWEKRGSLAMAPSADFFRKQQVDIDILLGATEKNRSGNDAFESYLGAKDSSSFTRAGASFLTAERELSKFSSECSALRESDGLAQVKSCLSLSRSVSDKVANSLSDIISVLRNSVDSSAFPQASIDAGIQSFSEMLAACRAKDLDLAALERSISHEEAVTLEAEVAAKQSVILAQSELSVTRKRLESAKLRIFSTEASESDNVRSAENRLTDAEAVLKWKQRPISDTELAPYLRLEESSRTSLKEAEERLLETVLKSAIDGTVVRTFWLPGEEVMAGKTAVTVADTGTPYVESEMEETDIGKIRLGQEALVVFDSLPEKTFTGSVTFVSPTSSTDANGVVTYRVRVTFGFSPFPVPEGSIASVDYVVKEAKNALIVPQLAIRRSENGNSTVFSVERNADTPVITGVSDGKITEVLEGLRQGERIRY